MSRSPALVLAYMALVLALVLVSSRASRADPALPEGITCDQVVHYAGEFSIPNTYWGRARAKVIAAALGFRLTNSQLEAAARCLASRGVRR